MIITTINRGAAMTRSALLLLTGVLLSAVAAAAAPGEPMTPIRQFIDGFNNGDTKTAYAAYAAATSSSSMNSRRIAGRGPMLPTNGRRPMTSTPPPRAYPMGTSPTRIRPASKPRVALPTW
jgi:hypothetical protein